MAYSDEAESAYRAEQESAHTAQNTREDDEDTTPQPRPISPFRNGPTTRSREEIQAEVPAHLILPNQTNSDDPHYARKFAYRVPTPAQPTQAQRHLSREMAERDAIPDLPMLHINGQIFEASRVINANLSRNMVEMIDKHQNKYRISATEILQMAKNHTFTAIEHDIKGTKYFYLTSPTYKNHDTI